MTPVTVAGGGSGRTAAEPTGVGPGVLTRREQWAVVAFGTWMVTGLFIDGWAHVADKPETFWTPWHGVLYSGFAAGMLFFGVERLRAAGRPDGVSGSDRVGVIGGLLFVAGAVGDALWHEIFGIEQDIEALLSPTHLALMTGGLMMLTAPLRAAGPDPGPGRWRDRGPVVGSVTLAAAVVAFFTQFASAFSPEPDRYAPGLSDAAVAGVLAVLVSNAVVVVPLVLTATRWGLPSGAALVMTAAPAVAVTGLRGFTDAHLALAAVAGGVVAEVLRPAPGDPRRLRWGCSATAASTWLTWFALARIDGMLGWSAELWAGTVALAVGGAWVLATLAGPPPASSGGEPGTGRSRTGLAKVAPCSTPGTASRSSSASPETTSPAPSV